MGIEERSPHDSPFIVAAPAPWRPDLPIRLYTSPELLRGFAADGRRAKLGEYLGLVHGNFPGCKTRGLSSCNHFHQGLDRPLESVAEDADVHVFITTPPCTYYFHDQFSDPAEKPAPKDSVFCVYARVFEDKTDAPTHLALILREHGVHGVVLGWEFVTADPEAKDRAHRCAERYKRGLCP